MRNLSEFDRELYERRENENEEYRFKISCNENENKELRQRIADNERWNRELVDDDSFMNLEDSQGWKYAEGIKNNI